MEVVLAVRAAVHSGSISRWLFAAICFGLEDPHRCCAAVLRGTTSGSPWRSAANVSSNTTGRDWGGRRSGIFGGVNRNGRRNFSHAGPAFLSVGSHSTSSRRLGAIHLGKLDRRTDWLFHK